MKHQEAEFNRSLDRAETLIEALNVQSPQILLRVLLFEEMADALYKARISFTHSRLLAEVMGIKVSLSVPLEEATLQKLARLTAKGAVTGLKLVLDGLKPNFEDLAEATHDESISAVLRTVSCEL